MSESQKGEFFLLGEIFLWSLFPVVSILSFQHTTPLQSAAWSTLVAALFFAAILFMKRSWNQINIRAAWKPILISSFIIGVVFYGLVFTGMQYTSAGNTSLIFLMEIFFTMLVLGSWGKEKITLRDFTGGCLMFLGALLILLEGTLSLNKGDFIILLATAVPPVGNYYAQQARKLVSSEYMLFIRSFISGVFLLLLSLLFTPEVNPVSFSGAFFFFIINGIFILGVSKVLWLEAIHRISITKALSLNALVPAFTLFFAYVFLSEIPTLWQLLGFIPIFIGIQLLSELFPQKKNKKAPIL